MMKTFGLIFLISSLLLAQANPELTAQPNPNQELITAQIKTFAQTHVENEQQLQTSTILDIFASSNLSKPEIALIYEQEYFKLKKQHDQKAEFEQKVVLAITIIVLVGLIAYLLYSDSRGQQKLNSILNEKTSSEKN